MVEVFYWTVSVVCGTMAGVAENFELARHLQIESESSDSNSIWISKLRRSPLCMALLTTCSNANRPFKMLRHTQVIFKHSQIAQKVADASLMRHVVPNFSTSRNHRHSSDQKYCSVQNATKHIEINRVIFWRYTHRWKVGLHKTAESDREMK